MDIKISTTGLNYTCAECKNDTSINSSSAVGDVIECPFCGIEYEIASSDEQGNYTLVMIEEEK